MAKKNVQKTIFSRRDDFDTIQAEIDSMIDDFTVTLSSEMEMQKMTGIPLQEGKFVAVLFHEKDIDLSYKVISNDNAFEEDVAFFRMRNPEESVMTQFQIQKLPALIVMMIDGEQAEPTEEEKKAGRVGMNLKLASYTGKFNYDDLRSYFRTFARPKENEEANTETSYSSSDNTVH